MKKRIVLGLALLFGLVAAPGKAEAIGRIYLGENQHILRIELDSAGYLRGLESKTRIHASQVRSANFNSDRVGWLNNSTAWGAKSRSRNFLIFRIANTANNDWGNWTIRLRNGTYRWLRINQFRYSGLTSTKLNNQVLYGNYLVAEISFGFPGTTIINFNSNVLSGFMSRVKTEEVDGIVWNSDRVGWFDNASVKGQLDRDPAGNFTAALVGMPNNDKGSFTLRKTDGTHIWLDITKWQFGAEVQINPEEGLISYGPYAPGKISLVSPGTAIVEFNVDMLSGFMGRITPTEVDYLAWNSDQVGWLEDSSVRGTLAQDPLGNFTFVIGDLPSNDQGTFVLRKTDGTFVWLDLSKWTFSENVIVRSADGQISYAVDP